MPELSRILLGAKCATILASPVECLVSGIIRQTFQYCTFSRLCPFLHAVLFDVLPTFRIALMRMATNVPELSARAMHPTTTLVLLILPALSFWFQQPSISL